MVFDDFDIKKIADSGQAFRITEEITGKWRFIAENKVLRLDEACPEIPEGFWSSYFDLETDYSVFRKAIPGEDKFLTAAAEYGRGIRILRQDPWEMIITFIISQRKNIPAIKKSVEAVCSLCGDPIEGEPGLFAFPTPRQLASLSEEDLKACSLGYRVPYILKTSRMVAEGAIDLESLRTAGDEELLCRLMELPGIGPKVANCVSLFGYHRIDAFPIDVWIARVIEEQYGGDFPFELYKGFGGVIQQYMFYYGRTGLNQ